MRVPLLLISILFVAIFHSSGAVKGADHDPSLGEENQGSCIDRIDALSEEVFLAKYYLQKPVLLTGITDNAALSSRMDVSYLARKLKKEKVSYSEAFELAFNGGSRHDSGTTKKLSTVLAKLEKRNVSSETSLNEPFVFERQGFFTQTAAGKKLGKSSKSPLLG